MIKQRICRHCQSIINRKDFKKYYRPKYCLKCAEEKKEFYDSITTVIIEDSVKQLNKSSQRKMDFENKGVVYMQFHIKNLR